MKKLTIAIAFIGLMSCAKRTNPKAYQIITTPDREYYTTFYEVDLETQCIEFTAYEAEDSSRVRVCQPWEVRKNPDYQQNVNNF